jgi:hypothetical protein
MWSVEARNNIVDEKALQHAKETLGETPQLREKCLQEIRNFLTENLHIKARDDTQTLLYFLRSCKFDVDRTKKKITG